MKIQSSSGEEPDADLQRKALFWRLMALSWRYRSGCIKVFSLQLVLLGLTLSGLRLAGLGIDFIRYRLDPSLSMPHWPLGWVPPEDWGNLKVLVAIGLATLGVSVLHGVATYFRSLIIARLIFSELIVDLRSSIYDKLQRLSFKFFDDHSSGTIINRVTGDVQNVRQFVDGVVIQGCSLLVSLVLCLAYMIHLHLGLTLACLATTPLLWMGVYSFNRSVKPAYQRNRELVDEMVTTYSESIQGMQVVKGFAREKEAYQKFVSRNREVKDQQNWIFWRVSLFSPSVMLLTQLNLMVLLGYGGYLVIHGVIPLGTGLLVFVGLLQQLSGQVNGIANIANTLQQCLIGAQRFFEVLDAPIDVANKAKPMHLEKAKGDVRFDRVSFSYKGDPVLRGLDFDVKAGQCVAILGATGSGKSTLMSLIPRFYDPTAGRVLIDGVDLRDYDLDELRRSIGIVFQENFLFSTSVASNIAFGNPKASMEQIEAAAKIACAHDFITKLSKGYQTVLGEGGVNLSGGQRQRLAIARAMLLNPSILLLDDPTAAIDSKTEHEILDAIDQAISGRTTFIVAHRLSTLRRADIILVLKGGAIVQRGTHDELMNQSGPYQRVAMLQLVDQESQSLLAASSGGEP